MLIHVPVWTSLGSGGPPEPSWQLSGGFHLPETIRGNYFNECQRTLFVGNDTPHYLGAAGISLHVEDPTAFGPALVGVELHLGCFGRKLVTVFLFS